MPVIGDSVVEVRADGYINATQLCKAGGKKFNNWYQLMSVRELINKLNEELGGDKVLVDKKVGGNHSGSWIHPRLATVLASWISPEFQLKVSRWVEEWRATSQENDQEYIKELSELKPTKNIQREKEIQLKLKDKYNGEIEIPVRSGFIDLMYVDDDNQYIVEIKEASKWKYALGQILCYGFDYPEHKKVVVLFGELNNIVTEIFDKYDIELRIESE